MLLSGIASFILAILVAFNISPTQAATTSSDIHVDVNSGTDNSSCGSESQPCASIQYAINMAADSGQTIRVAAGTYKYNAAADSCSSVIGTTAVACLRNKEVTILGGFTANNWVTSDPETNLTIIDGQNSKRTLLVQHGSGQPAATLTMEGFTVQNGRVQGAGSGSEADISAFGGGMRADSSTVILRHMIFKNNQALGGNTSTNHGGSAAGGGIAIRSGAGTSILEHITFDNNQAIGGTGGDRGGLGIGGGLYTFESIVSGSYITFTNNLSQGGNSNGDGIDLGENADGQGGGAALHRNSTVTLEHVTATDNQTIGGNALNGQGGGAFGGGIYTESSVLVTIINATIHNNLALGGEGKNASSGGSVSFGGGIATTNASFTLDQASVINNASIGGDGSQIGGSGNGGGASFVRTEGSSVINVTNSIFANNLVELGAGSNPGGGGGGIYMRGSSATISQSTIAQNELGSSSIQGNGVLLISGSSASISYSIIAEHTIPSNAYALYADPNNTITLLDGLFSGNNLNNNNDGIITGVGTMINGSASFKSAGAPDYDYHIQDNSDARDAAAGSPVITDVDGENRDASPDIGADEYIPPTITHLIGAPYASQSVLVTWDVIYMEDKLDHYEIEISCPAGANRPNEVDCDTPLNVGTAQQIQLTGLTNFATYGITLRALDNSSSELDSKSCTFIPTNIFVYLPVVVRN